MINSSNAVGFFHTWNPYWAPLVSMKKTASTEVLRLNLRGWWGVLSYLWASDSLCILVGSAYRVLSDLIPLKIWEYFKNSFLAFSGTLKKPTLSLSASCLRFKLKRGERVLLETASVSLCISWQVRGTCMHQWAAGLAQPLLCVVAAVVVSCEAELCTGHASCSNTWKDGFACSLVIYLWVDYFCLSKTCCIFKIISPQCAVRTSSSC